MLHVEHLPFKTYGKTHSTWRISGTPEHKIERELIKNLVEGAPRWIVPDDGRTAVSVDDTGTDLLTSGINFPLDSTVGVSLTVQGPDA